MKRMLCLLMMLAMVFSLAACTTSSQPPAATSAPPASTGGSSTNTNQPAAQATEAPLVYPNGPVTMIIPFNPGGGVDISGRLMGDALANELGVTIVVENLPGAGGIMGFNALAQRPADGQTIMICGISSSAWVANVMSEAPLPWNADDDFQFLGRMNYQPSVYGLYVSADSPYHTILDLVQAIRDNPGKINAGIQGPNSTADPGHQEFLDTFDLDVNIIYYPDSAETQTAIMTGDIVYSLSGINRTAFVENPNFRTLVFYDDSPSDWPVQGIPSFRDYQEELDFNYDDLKYIPMEVGGTFLCVKAGTDPRICEMWTNAMEKICQDEEYKAAVLAQSYMALFASPEESLKIHQDMAEAMREYVAMMAQRNG